MVKVYAFHSVVRVATIKYTFIGIVFKCIREEEIEFEGTLFKHSKSSIYAGTHAVTEYRVDLQRMRG